ncbi:glycosyltransferase [Asticcacaulis sp. AC402]|uniref:glycosyltransferase n=1 Tax=Asticcacaulis sp. AC402 TaxID=1282361 RepID=UPI0003C3E421|nr:glycosyltransferase [Asticcacaulis sp. AC402]ESQ75757.1 glycosyl transferase family 1 [Asticcacaulis sp. AC402]
MPGLRYLPLRYRLPLIHGGLNLLARGRCGSWTKAGAVAPKPGPLVVSGFLRETLGIGRAGRMTARALKAAGFSPIEHDLRPAFKHLVFQGAKLPGDGGVWLIHANAPECLVAFMAHAPQTWAHRYRIGYWAWETPKAPADWVWLADYLHEIWLPSRFVHDAMVKAFRQAGRDDLSSRLRVMPHPAPHPVAIPYHDAQQKFGLDPDLCEVLCLFDTKSGAVRKNPWSVLEAWREAFPLPAAHARLTLKVSDMSGDRDSEQRLTNAVAIRPDIRVITQRLSDADMDGLIAASDVLISLHRSEGFGLTLAEAMASGVGVIATGWSGNIDFMNDNNSRLIPVRTIPIRDPDGPYCIVVRDSDQVWAEPDVSAAAEALRALTTDEVLRRHLIAAAQRDVRKLDAPWQSEVLKTMALNLYLGAGNP